tara:strand:- start:169 stop:615 length:447 start_codon:yes stop_codon:yes gene_type:complete
MGLTDCIDGVMARYLNCVSLLGAYLDAIADKIMINAAFLILYSINILPHYILILAISRDLIIFTGILLKNKNNNFTEMNPIFLSKVNTFMQILLVIYCLLFLNTLADIKYIQDIINVVTLTTIASALEYIYNYKNNIFVKNVKLTANI